MYWMACLLVLLVIGAAGYLLRHPIHIQSNWMHVTYLDGDGNQSSEWVYTPDPERVPKNGLRAVADYAERLTASDAPQASLIISSMHENKAVLVMRLDPQFYLMEHIDLAPPSQAEPDKERAIRKLFEELKIAPIQDFVHDYNGVPDAMRDLDYPIGTEAKQMTTIIQRVLREVYHIKEEEGLYFTLEA